MNLQVHIARGRDGVLEAYVLQQCTRSANLLAGKKLKKVLAAQVDLLAKLKDHKVTFTGEPAEGDLKRASDLKVSTPRDNYGWRSL